ncbi:MAG: alpha/beta fold hydrolase [Nevskiales bacterium]
MTAAKPRSGRVDIGELHLYYEDWGDKNHPVVLLIMGLGAQLVAWPDEFVQALVDGGYRVLRYDNRDVGLSAKIKNQERFQPIRNAYVRAKLGFRVSAPYTLKDMARDAVALLDALEIDKVHVVGASMGGMIAQLVAALHAERVLSLVSLMSSSGAAWLPSGKLQLLLRMVTKPPSTERDVLLAHYMKTMRMMGSPGFPMSREEMRARTQRWIERAYHPAGTARQMLAILATGSRVKYLRKIKAPTLVLHGKQDPLVPAAHGKHTARCIPGAKLELIDGMGHDLPPALLPRLAAVILQHLDSMHSA